MIVYRGLGYVALAAFALTLFGLAYVLDVLLGTDSLSLKPAWPLLASGLAAAGVTWSLGRFLNREPLAVTVYEVTGPRTIFETKHTLYLIRMEYWGPILFALVIAVVATH